MKNCFQFKQLTLIKQLTLEVNFRGYMIDVKVKNIILFYIIILLTNKLIIVENFCQKDRNAIEIFY